MFLALCRAPVIPFLFHFIGTSDVQCVGNFPGFFVDFTVKTVVAVGKRSVQKVIRIFFNSEVNVGMVVI